MNTREAGTNNTQFQITQRPGYQITDISEGFDWEEIFRNIPQQHTELVVFRSTSCVQADRELIAGYDNAAHQEAIESGGLICYFKGTENEDGQNLSFCLWESEDALRKAAGKPKHREAAGVAVFVYKSFNLERYSIAQSQGKEGKKLIFEKK